MMSRPVLVIHANPAARDAVRALLAGHPVLEAENRSDAVPLLSRAGLALVLAQPHEFRRLLRDLERHTPGTPRAVLCPEDPGTLKQLAELAAEGYEFTTIPEGNLEHVRRLVAPRGASRVVPVERLRAHFVAGGHELEAEVVELSSDGLGLRLPPTAPVEALTPGLALERATAHGSGGVVLEARTWVVRTLRREPGGAGEVHVGVHVEPAPGEAHGRPPARINDEVRVRGLVRRAVARRASFVLHVPDGSARREYTQPALEADGRLVLRQPRPGHAFSAGEIVRVSFELLGSQVEAVTALLEADDTRVVVASPRSALRRERREALRVRPTDDAPGIVTLRSPLTGTVLSRRLVDLHPLGASFELDGGPEAVPPGLVLSDVELELGSRRARCTAVVQSAQALDEDGTRRRVGLKLKPASDVDRQALIDAWLALLVPDVACGSRFDFATLWGLFEHEGVRFPDYPYDAAGTLPTLTKAHLAMGDGRHGLGKAFVFHEDREVLGHASGLRTHSRTWLSQHLVVRSGYHRQTHISQTLVNLSFDYAEALGDVDYLRGLWRTSNRWTCRVYGAATARLLRPGLACLSEFTPMRAALSAPGPTAETARVATDEERRLLIAQLRRTWDPLRLLANDLNEDELTMPTLARRYASVGLERSRHVGVVEGPNGPRGWVLIERMTPGLFWAEWYDAFRIILAEPQAPDAQAVTLALASFGLDDARRRGRRYTHALADDAEVRWLEASGFTNLGKVIEFCAHRSMNREMTAQLMAIFERLARRGREDARGHDEE